MLELKVLREILAHVGHFSVETKIRLRSYDHLPKVNWDLVAAWARSLVS